MAQTEIEAVFRPKSGLAPHPTPENGSCVAGVGPIPRRKTARGWLGGKLHSAPGKPCSNVGPALGAFGLESGKLTLQVAPRHREERSAQSNDFRLRQMLDIQESAQGRNQPVAAVAVLIAVKPSLTNRLGDKFQGAAAMPTLVEPIERLSRSMPGGDDGGSFRAFLSDH